MELAPWGKVGIHEEGPLVDANDDFIFLFGGADESQHWGWDPLHPARLGEEVPADSWGLDWPPVRAHCCQPRPARAWAVSVCP